MTANSHTAPSLELLARENQTLLDAAPVGIAYLRDRIIQRCNRRMEEIFGYGPNELDGCSTRLLYRNQAAFEVGEQLYARLALGETHQIEDIRVRRDGSRFWCRLRGRAMDPARPEQGSVWIIEDVTQRKAEELAMHSLSIEQQAILDNAYTGIVFLEDRRVRRFNRRFHEMFGYTPEEVLHKPVRFFYPSAEENEAVSTIAYREMSRGDTYTGEHQLLRRDGSLFWARITGRSMDPERPAQQSVWLIDDVTVQRAAREELEQRAQQRKEVERQLIAARDAAIAGQRAQTTFLASMSHELRTPLNSILGYAQIMLSDKSLEAPQAEGVKTIKSSGEQLLALINDILDLARIEAGKFDLFPGPIHLAIFLKSVADSIKSKAQQKGLAFVLATHGILPEAVQADEQRLRQVLLNLLENAVKFTDRGQVRLDVRALRADDAQARIRFEVCDTGIGIEEEQVQPLFQPFEQAAPRRVAGSGLGLPISRQLVRLMGSDIVVDSVPGECSRFWFELSLPVLPMGTEAATGYSEQMIAEPVAAQTGAAALESVPTPEQLKPLYGYALTGNMAAIADEAARLLAIDDRYRPFTDTVRRLAKEYQPKALTALIKGCLERHPQ